MDLSFTEHEERFRADAREWLEAHAPRGDAGSVLGGAGPVAQRFERGLVWERTMFEGGWAGLSWPVEYGGRGASAIEALIFAEELARVGAPDPVNLVGLVTAGPTIMAAGTNEQRARLLPAILRAEEVWCQGFSEPDAGSDLASLRTSAEPVPGGFRVTGQKVWTSFAQFAQRCILLARTKSTGANGITCLLVDMDQPGIEVKPLRQLSGESEFNAVLFDGVFVADEDVLGEVGGGWTVMRAALANERGNAALAQHEEAHALFRAVRRVATDTGRHGDPVVRQALARCFTSARIVELLNYRTATALALGGRPGNESSTSKLVFSETQRRTAQLGIELLGAKATLLRSDERDAEAIRRRFLWSIAGTIAGGTSEIQRNIIGERLLGLPREPRISTSEP